MKKYLIAIDLDGTLRHDDGLISNYSKKVIQTLRRKGHVVVTATARPHKHAIKVNEEIFKSDYLICLSGSEVYDIKKNKTVNEEYINSDDVNRLYEYAIKNDIGISFSIGDNEYTTKFKTNDEQIYLTDKAVLNGNVKESFILDNDKTKIMKFYEEMKDMNIPLVCIDCDQPFFIVLANQVNKGYGIKKLAEYLDLKHIISFGNDENDIPMFKHSNIGIAVSNSTNETLKQADYIINSNNDDAVCKYLQKKFKLY